MSEEFHFVIRRKKSHLFLSIDQNEPVVELKRMIEAILKIPVLDQELSYTDETENRILLKDNYILFYTFTSNNSMPHRPIQLGLKVKGDESLMIDEMSKPPQLPSVTDME